MSAAFSSNRIGRPLHRCRAWTQSHLQQPRATADRGGVAERPRSGAGSKRHLVTQVAATGLASRPAAAYRSQYHPSCLAPGRLRLRTQPHLVSNRHSGACAASAGFVTVHDPQAQEKQRLIELAYRIAEAAGVELWCQDEAGPYQAIPQPGEDWHLQGYPRQLPHEYAPGGTAKLLTLFRPATGQVRAKGVLSAPNAVLHPWLKEDLTQILQPMLQREPEVDRPAEAERAEGARWRTWLWPHKNDEGLPPLRILLVWDNLAGHLSHDLLPWLFHHGIMPLYTPLGGSWLNMAESLQRIIVRRALAGQHPQQAQEVIDWLEQTVAGWNVDPTPFVWGGKRHARRVRARLRRLGGSGAALVKGYSIAA